MTEGEPSGRDGRCRMPASAWWRPVAGAILLDLAVSTLFVWDVFVPVIAGQLRVGSGSLSVVFSVGLAAFTAGVLGGGALADRLSPRALAIAVAAVTSAGLAATAGASSVPELVATFSVTVG